MPIYALGDLLPSIDPSAFVHPDAVLIGDVVVGAEASVWPMAVVRGDTNRITIGDRSSVQDGAVLHCTSEHPTIIGSDCVIGHLAHLEGCEMRSGSLVGSGATVLHRSIVHSGALVGAAALVPGGVEIPEGAMALGVPAKILENRSNREAIVLNADHYVHKARRFLAEMRRVD